MPQWLFFNLFQSFQIEICNLDRTKSSFLATSLYKKVIFTKNWVTRSCRPSDYHSSTIQKKKILYWKVTCKIAMIFVVQTLQGGVFFALCNMLVLIRSRELYARTMTMEDPYQVKIMLQSCASNGNSDFYSTVRGTMHDTHWIHKCVNM